MNTDLAPDEVITSFHEDCDYVIKSMCRIHVKQGGGTMLPSESYYDVKGKLVYKNPNTINPFPIYIIFIYLIFTFKFNFPQSNVAELISFSLWII